MPGWMMHLRVAERISDRMNVQGYEFYAGNIAPDSSRYTKEGFNPPTEITHFTVTDKSGCDYMKFAEKYIDCEHDTNRRLFYIGYFCHLMTDVLWSKNICRPCEEKYSDEFSCDEAAFYRNVKKNWHAVDFDFIESNPQFKPLVYFRNVRPLQEDLIEFYPERLIEHKLEFVYRYYHEKRVYNTDYRYLTAETADRFVSESAQIICDELHRLGYAVYREACHD